MAATKTTTKGSTGKATTASKRQVQVVSSKGRQTVDADKVPTYSGKPAADKKAGVGKKAAQDKKPAPAEKPAQDAQGAPQKDAPAEKPARGRKPAQKGAQGAQQGKPQGDKAPKAPRASKKAAKKDQGEDGKKVRDLSGRHSKRDPELAKLIPAPGSVIVKKFKGKEYEFTMLEGERVLFNGVEYSGLWAAGKALTGYPSLNPYTFFGLKKVERATAKRAEDENVEDF